MRLATIFSGGEGVGIGARQAGLQHLWGVEINDAIADVARRNGFHIVTGDVCSFDPDSLERPDVLHASPPCPNFSQAKQGAEETEADIELARATARFIEALKPDFFTLENVWMYRKSESWSIIRRSLYDCGYWLDVAHVNAADYSVPQSRKRMIVRAALGRMVPYLPAKEPWIGWYEAIEDLIPSLPETELAPWQLNRLDETLLGTVLFAQGISRDRSGNEYPLLTRALLVGGQFGRPSDGNGGDRPPQVIGLESPLFTVTASHKGDWRAVLFDGQNSKPQGRITTRLDNEPALTICASTKEKGMPRAVLNNGRVVLINLRCLARWQTFPDWYELPITAVLGSYIIGNAVPPLFYQKIINGLVSVK